jgi:hypothetical protein
MAKSNNVGITQPKNAVIVIRGESKTFKLCVVDESGVPVDLTGARLIMTVKEDITDELCVIRKDSSKGVGEIDIDEPKAGCAKIYLTPSDTHNKDCGEYIFDVWVVLASGKQHPVIKTTTFQIVAGVTVIT